MKTKLLKWLRLFIRSPREPLIFPVDKAKPLTIAEKQEFVDRFLRSPEARRLIDKYIRWKADNYTRAAMAAETDRDMFGKSERAYAIGGITVDFQQYWEEVQRHDKEIEDQKIKKKQQKPFKFFGQSEDHED